MVGASSGIGRALALAACSARCGVVLSARRAEALESAAAEARAAGGVAHALACDVTDSAAAEALAGSAGDLLGGLDAVVFAAGTAPLSLVSATSAARWDEVLTTNVVGAALVAAGALEHLRASAGAGRPRPVLALLSTHTIERPWPGLVAYAASKAALEALGRGLRHEEPWLRVLNVAVGNTMTGFADGWDQSSAAEAFGRWTQEGYFDGTAATAQETAAAVLDAMADDGGPDDVSAPG